MSVISQFHFKSSTNRLKILPFLLFTRTNFSTPENLCAHLINHPKNPEKTLFSISHKLDQQYVSEILQTFSSKNPLLGLRFFIWAGDQLKYRHTKYMYSLACELLEIERNPGRIRGVFECYRVDGCSINVKMFRVVFNLCREAKVVDEGLWVLRKMEGFRCRPDSMMYNVVIGLFCERGDVDKAVWLMREMELCNLCPDMITFVSMIKGFCNVGRLEDACEVFRSMKVKGCDPSMVVYSVLIDGFCRAGRFEEGLMVLVEMEKEGGECAPNVVTYTSIIQKLCENGRSNEALSVLERMEGSKCCPNRVTVSVIVQGLCVEGNVDKAFSLVSDVVAKGPVSSSECYSCLVISLFRVKRLEEAYKLLRWMVDSSVRPDGLACSMLMKDMCLKGRFVDAFSLFEDIGKKGFVVTIDSDIIVALLVGLCAQNCDIEVEKLACLMVEKRIHINASYIDEIHKYRKGSNHMNALVQLIKRDCVEHGIGIHKSRV